MNNPGRPESSENYSPPGQGFFTPHYDPDDYPGKNIVQVVVTGKRLVSDAWDKAFGDDAVKAAASNSFKENGFAYLMLGMQLRGMKAAALAKPGTPPPNMSPPGAGRSGAFNAAKRGAGVPTSQQPSRVLPNEDLRGNAQPGRIYEFEVPAPGGGTRPVRIREDSSGHDFGPGNPQNRGPHFNDPAGNHYDYNN